MDVEDLGNNYFTVTPVNKRWESLEPGQVYTGSITIVNPAVATEDFYYQVSVAPYSVVGPEYNADLTTNTGYTMLTNWITIDDPNGVVGPNGVKTINYTITVPENAPAGGQYAALIVSRDPKITVENAPSVAVKDVYEVASLVYAEIAGETIHKGEILENNIPSFVMSAPITVGAMLSNHGNVHEAVTLYIQATDVFTGEILVGLDEKEEEVYYTELIMPETERYIERSINNNLPQLGIVRVEQTIYYNGQTSKESRDVIICPIWFLVLMVLLVFMLIGGIVYLVRRHRKKKAVKKKQVSTE